MVGDTPAVAVLLMGILPGAGATFYPVRYGDGTASCSAAGWLDFNEDDCESAAGAEGWQWVVRFSNDDRPAGYVYLVNPTVSYVYFNTASSSTVPCSSATGYYQCVCNCPPRPSPPPSPPPPSPPDTPSAPPLPLPSPPPVLCEDLEPVDSCSGMQTASFDIPDGEFFSLTKSPA